MKHIAAVLALKFAMLSSVPSWPDKPATVHIQVIPVSISRRAAGPM